MDLPGLLDILNYGNSPNFIAASSLERATELERGNEHSHTFRRALHTCNLEGVYVLNDGQHTSTPVVYVASAGSRDEANAIHKKVWNQNVVPFLIVTTPECLRLYSGFRFGNRQSASDKDDAGVLEAAIKLSEVAKRLRGFTAQNINDGTLWRERGHDVTPSTRVDWRLLANLRKLAETLRLDGLHAETAHSLIGKFVYLRYLQDREILSERKLAEWDINQSEVFGRKAKLTSVRKLIECVDEWLNGSIFPLQLTGLGAPTAAQVQQVSAVFLGDDIASGQQHLDFKAYDFSHIPIETLSIIYEQFLALEEKNKPKGAYYTPIPLVNFMLAELDDQLPLKPGMKILDPACGSGAFLVQCYRRLVERELRQRPNGKLRPSELRDLLVRHIFGVDSDLDACRVTELSLLLTMLDYIDPPDLQTYPTFRLPTLHDQNIVESDFFDLNSTWQQQTRGRAFDWIVGNPPWISAASKKTEGDEDDNDAYVVQTDEEDDSLKDPAHLWITKNKKQYPVVRNDVAEAFAWKVTEHLSQGGRAAMLLPAMSLFQTQRDFRTSFFRTVSVSAVANFSNLREVLFAGRARMPAAAFFYSRRTNDDDYEHADSQVLVYSPLVANQAANLPMQPGTRLETWNITLDNSEVRSYRCRDVLAGDNLPWKLAMWGSHRDAKFLKSLAKRFPTLGAVENERGWFISEGPQLRHRRSREPVEPVAELEGKPELDSKTLRRLEERLYFFPPRALSDVGSERAYVRKGRAKSVEVCRPPLVVVSAAFNFAVFQESFVVVPPRQYGISGPKKDANLLKAVSLLLSSDFALYFMFLTSPQQGVRDGRINLASLRALPIPKLAEDQVAELCDIHANLVACSRDEDSTELARLQWSMNRQVENIMRLNSVEQSLVKDLVQVRMHLSDGQFGDLAVRPPTDLELRTYVETLRQELDAFVGRSEYCHRVSVVIDRSSGMVEIAVAEVDSRQVTARVLHANQEEVESFGALRAQIERKAGQWLYFDRNLLIHLNGRTYLLKPLQRFWWTQSQAFLDADEVIAEQISNGGQK